MSSLSSVATCVAVTGLALVAVNLDGASAAKNLLGLWQDGASTVGIAAGHDAASRVNRAAKGDRAPVVAQKGGITISFRVPGMEDSSVALRVPTGNADARKNQKASERPVRNVVACEPVVSVLTAVAKQLEPGRCVT